MKQCTYFRSLFYILWMFQTVGSNL